MTISFSRKKGSTDLERSENKRKWEKNGMGCIVKKNMMTEYMKSQFVVGSK